MELGKLRYEERLEPVSGRALPVYKGEMLRITEVVFRASSASISTRSIFTTIRNICRSAIPGAKGCGSTKAMY